MPLSKEFRKEEVQAGSLEIYELTGTPSRTSTNASMLIHIVRQFKRNYELGIFRLI